MSAISLLASVILASQATGDVGPVIPGIMECSPPGGPPITVVCDDGHNCCIMPVYDAQGRFLDMVHTCCIKGSACRSQRVGTGMIVFCEYPPRSSDDSETPRSPARSPGLDDAVASK